MTPKQARREAVKVYDIPSAWLMGAVQIRERDGMEPMEALRDAVRVWREHEELARRWAEEHA